MAKINKTVFVCNECGYESAKWIGATSDNHINAMDMNSEYGDGANPVILKSESILSLCEQLMSILQTSYSHYGKEVENMVLLVPFINKFPKNTKLYKLMTTKPGEN